MLPSPAAVATGLRMATTPVASPTQSRVSRVVAAMRPNCGRERIWFISIEFKAEGRWTMLPPGCAGKTGRHLVVDQGGPGDAKGADWQGSSVHGLRVHRDGRPGLLNRLRDRVRPPAPRREPRRPLLGDGPGHRDDRGDRRDLSPTHPAL